MAEVLPFPELRQYLEGKNVFSQNHPWVSERKKRNERCFTDRVFFLTMLLLLF